MSGLFSNCCILIACGLLLNACGIISDPSIQKISKTKTPANYQECNSTSSTNYTTHIQPILKRACVVCHQTGGVAYFLPLDTYESAKRNIQNILRTAKAGTMPPPRSAYNIPKDDIATLEKWVSSKTPENPVACPSPGASPTPSPTPTPVKTSQCDQRTRKPLPLKRLTKFFYRNVLEDLFGAAILSKPLVIQKLSTVPNEDLSKGFSSFDSSITEAHIQAYHQVAWAIASEVSVSTTTRGALNTCLSGADPNMDTCLVPFFRSFGLRAFRRPLTTDEITLYKDLYNQAKPAGVSYGIETVLTAFLQSPSFLYLLDTGSIHYNVAQQLSFGLWGRLPDTTLLNLAQAGELRNSTAIKSQIDRMMNDPKGLIQAKNFFREWVGTNTLPSFSQSSTFLNGISTAGLGAAMAQEVEDFFDYIFWTSKGTLADLYLSPKAFVRTQALSQIYGGVPLNQWVDLKGGERKGLLTRAFFAADKTDNSHPFHVGLNIRERFLCQKLVAPDPNDFPDIDPKAFSTPPFDPKKSTRQTYTEITNFPECASCHNLLAIGFGFGNYDTLGRFRIQEQMFLNGQPVASHAINSEVFPYLDGANEAPLQGPIRLVEAIANSERAQNCFSQRWTEYALGVSSETSDTCLHEDLSKRGSLKEVLKAFYVMPEVQLEGVIGN